MRMVDTSSKFIKKKLRNNTEHYPMQCYTHGDEQSQQCKVAGASGRG